MRPVFLALFVLGCRAPSAPGGVGALPAREPPPAPRASAGGAASEIPTAASIRLVPLAPPSLPAALPRLEVLEPAFGDTLDPRFALKHPVRLRVEGTPLGADAEGVVVSLDGGRPRRVLADRGLMLGDLLPAGAHLAEGPHVLLAVALTADGRALRAPASAASRPLSSVGFFVGRRTTEPASAASPNLFCLDPSGTYYLKPGAPLPFEVLATGWEPGALRLQIRANGAELETSFDPGQSYAVHGLPLGDVQFTVGRAPGPHAQCVATVNQEPAEARTP